MTDSSSVTGGDRSAESSSSENTAGDGDEELQPPRYHPPRQEQFDWRGWLLVGVIVVSFLVIPGAILYLPHAQGFIARIGISWRQAYLALPMIPALLLGGTAIWAAVSSRRASK